MIDIKNVSKSFGDKVVLKDVCLKIDDGKVFGLVGVNGAGKSTLLRIIAGVYQSNAGEVIIENQNVYDNPKVKKDVFFLSDNPYYPKNWNVSDFLNFYSTYYNVNISTFNRLLKKFDLPFKKSINNFSKGMKRQLFLALAIAISPKYLLLDEAFDGIDPLARLTFKRELIDAIEQNNITVIISSHSLRELEDICDNYGILDKNKILYSGNLETDKSKLNTYQVAFKDDKTIDDFKEFDVIHFSKLGKVIKVVIKGDKDVIMEKIKAMNPLLLEIIPLNFEDMFVYQVEKEGYLKNEK